MAAQLFPGRYMAQIEGDFVVFLIGMRLNKLWAVHKWWPVAMAMPKMLQELGEHPELGYLGGESFTNGRTALIVQYWRSFDHLEHFARSAQSTHLPAWKAFNQAVGADGSVGIWHETYLVRAGEYENLYGNMPRFGLAAAAEHGPVTAGRQAARERMRPANRNGGTSSHSTEQSRADALVESS